MCTWNLFSGNALQFCGEPFNFSSVNMNRIKVANPSEGENDYINASLVAVSEEKHFACGTCLVHNHICLHFLGCIFFQCTGYRAEYVIAQHPLMSEIENFWRMIMEKHVSKIVVIGPVKEEVRLCS